MSANLFGIPAARLFGVPVVQSDLCTRRATPGEDARRIVRHGLSDVLEWLGEPVGPRPGERVPTAYLMENAGGRTILAHRSVVADILKGAVIA